MINPAHESGSVDSLGTATPPSTVRRLCLSPPTMGMCARVGRGMVARWNSEGTPSGCDDLC